MKKIAIVALLIVSSFCLGFAFKTVLNKKSVNKETKRVTSIGGIFFKCENPEKLRQWYKTHLGLTTNDYGTVFEWRQATDSTQKGFTQWSPFNKTTTYFEPSAKDFMINYRVADLDWLIVQLKKEGVTVVDTIATYEYGKFVHIMDIEGNKIELWEPNDVEFEKLGKSIGSKTTK